MSIPNTARDLRSYIAGMIASDSPTRIDTAVLKYTLDATGAENFATPSRACTVNGDGETVAPGGKGVFAGLIVGNMRVPSSAQESWYQNGDTIELMLFGEIAVNIDNSADDPSSGAAVGGPVYYHSDNGKLLASNTQTDADIIQIPGAVITKIDDGSKLTRSAVVMLNGPQPS